MWMGWSYFSRNSQLRMGPEELPGTYLSNFSGVIANRHGHKKLPDQMGSIRSGSFSYRMEGLD